MSAFYSKPMTEREFTSNTRGCSLINEKIRAALAGGGATEYDDAYFMTQPRFETGDARYRWLNRVAAVGEGRLEPGLVEYRIFELING